MSSIPDSPKSTGKKTSKDSPVQPDVNAAFDLYEKEGWLWKRSVGKSFLGLGPKNWKTRYVTVTLDSVQYFAQEPFDHPKGTILWEAVTHIYPSCTADVDPDASDTSKYYFGMRFLVGGGKEEKLLLFRCETAAERQDWIRSFSTMHKEHLRVREMIETDDDEDDDGVSRPHSKKSRRDALDTRGTFMEAISVKLRNLVSLKKQRYQQDGIDLDLAYITPQIIAMGFPAEGKEGVYRNPMDQVVAFFDRYHKHKYKVYNLCAERSYPPNRFGGKFARYPFDDHNPPPLELLLPLCQDMESFLSGDASVGCLLSPEDDSLAGPPGQYSLTEERSGSHGGNVSPFRRRRWLRLVRECRVGQSS